MEGVEANGLSGLFQTLYRMIDPRQPSAECIQHSDNCFASAATPAEAWDCGNSMVSCLRTSPPAPPIAPPEPPPRPVPPLDPETDSMADVALAAPSCSSVESGIDLVRTSTALAGKPEAFQLLYARQNVFQ